MNLDIDKIMQEISESSPKEQSEFHKRYTEWHKFVRSMNKIACELMVNSKKQKGIKP